MQSWSLSDDASRILFTWYFLCLDKPLTPRNTLPKHNQNTPVCWPLILTKKTSAPGLFSSELTSLRRLFIWWQSFRWYGTLVLRFWRSLEVAESLRQSCDQPLVYSVLSQWTTCGWHGVICNKWACNGVVSAPSSEGNKTNCSSSFQSSSFNS